MEKTLKVSEKAELLISLQVQWFAGFSNSLLSHGIVEIQFGRQLPIKRGPFNFKVRYSFPRTLPIAFLCSQLRFLWFRKLWKVFLLQKC